MSENGPREGTRDLPRRDPDSGRRAVDPESQTARAHRAHGREKDRRTAEVLALAEERLSPEEIVRRYARDHPQEHPMTLEDVAEILRARR